MNSGYRPQLVPIVERIYLSRSNVELPDNPIVRVSEITKRSFGDDAFAWQYADVYHIHLTQIDARGYDAQNACLAACPATRPPWRLQGCAEGRINCTIG